MSRALEKRVMEILADVPDPEIPWVSVVDLGIVRGFCDGTLFITPTYTGCPATHAIEAGIRAALNREGLKEIEIETILSPPWTTDWISKEGCEKLRAHGIVPPSNGAANRLPAACPRCGSLATEEISRFGSTPCKALHRCHSCGEPFDRFKCH